MQHIRIVSTSRSDRLLHQTHIEDNEQVPRGQVQLNNISDLLKDSFSMILGDHWPHGTKKLHPINGKLALINRPKVESARNWHAMLCLIASTISGDVVPLGNVVSYHWL